MNSNTSSPLFWEVPKDDSGLPFRIGLLKYDVFEPVWWHYPSDTTSPIPWEITSYLLSQNIVASPGGLYLLKISDLPLPPLPDPDPASEAESHASSATDSQGNQSNDSSQETHTPNDVPFPAPPIPLQYPETDSDPDRSESDSSQYNFSADLDRSEDDSDADSRASSISDSSQGHQSYDSHYFDNVPEAIHSGTAGDIRPRESRASLASYSTSPSHQEIDTDFLLHCARSDSESSERAPDSSQSHQSFTSTFLRDCARSEDSADGGEAVGLGDEIESDTEENASDDEDVSIEDVSSNGQDSDNERADQNGDERNNPNFSVINDESTFPPYVQFQRLRQDCLVQWTAAYRDAVDQIWELRERNSIPRTRVLLVKLKLTKTLVDLHSRFETFRLQGHVLHRGDRFKTYGFPFSRFKDIFVTPRKRFRIPYCEYCGKHKVWFDFKQDRQNFVDHKFIHNPRRPLDEACDHDRTVGWLEEHKDCIHIF